MKRIGLVLAASTMTLAGCAATNSYLAERETTVEMYHIFDIKTAADTSTVAKAATDGLSQNTNELSSNLPLQLNKKIPDVPGRFTLVDLGKQLQGTGMGSFLQLANMRSGGIGIKAANCDGAVWTSRAQRDISGYNNLTLYSCLFRYKAGYQLDIYAVFQKREGGLYQVSQNIANSIVGTPEAWVNKTIVDTVRAIEVNANAKITHVEGQPVIANLPWVDQIDTNIKAGKRE